MKFKALAILSLLVSPAFAAEPTEWCFPLNPYEYHFEDAPEVSPEHPHVVLWKGDCIPARWHAVFYSDAEQDAFIAAIKRSPTKASLAAYRAANPGTSLTDPQRAWVRAYILAKEPPPPAAPPFIVQRQSASVAGTRPVFRMRPNGTWDTTAVPGVRVAGSTPCDGSRRIGTTSYYFVPSVGYYALCVRVP